MANRTPKVGTVIAVPVNQQNIDNSTPCDKDHCMLSLAGAEVLESRFGKGNYKIRSTNHGMTFDINGYRVLTVFDHLTGHRIYKYDEIYKKTKSMQKAKASVKPFKAKLMIESCHKLPVFEPMSEEKKKKLAEWRKMHPAKDRDTGLRAAKRRQLSE